MRSNASRRLRARDRSTDMQGTNTQTETLQPVRSANSPTRRRNGRYRFARQAGTKAGRGSYSLSERGLPFGIVLRKSDKRDLQSVSKARATVRNGGNGSSSGRLGSAIGAARPLPLKQDALQYACLATRWAKAGDSRVHHQGSDRELSVPAALHDDFERRAQRDRWKQ